MDEGAPFEWDEEKNRANLRKHYVDFEEASKVFLDQNRLEFDDDNSTEVRWNVIGFVGERLVHVTYTIRGDSLRIISARKAESHERRKYHEVQA